MKLYLMQILCATFLCAIVGSIGGAGQGTRRLISGVFLALALLHPLGTLDLPKLTLDPFLAEADEAIESGQAQAQSARKTIISESLEAYILTKAQELHLNPEIEVTLDDGGLPQSVTIICQASPSEREALTNTITTALGLRKEDIQWKENFQGGA